MKYAPVNWKPTNWSISNGQPTRAVHAQEIDRATSWLATRKAMVPAILGVFTSGTTYSARFTIPQYTQYVRFGLVASGRGSVTLTSADDTYNCVSEVYAGAGTTGTHSVDDAVLHWVDGPVAVSANGSDRSLDVTDQSSPAAVTFTFAITDQSGSQTLKVYAIVPRFVERDESAELPA